MQIEQLLCQDPPINVAIKYLPQLILLLHRSITNVTGSTHQLFDVDSTTILSVHLTQLHRYLLLRWKRRQVLKNTNPNVEEEEIVSVLDASEIRRRAILVAMIFWKFWNHPNLRIFKGVAGTPDLIFHSGIRLIQEYHQYHPL
ncbi:hypothetical protein PIB30_030869 [Stylosanthes scabra]|uniref:Uncharacterized protein n=1 Tax=Stylosanthes scabra TaxID=79078 RepID=A0ABU6WCN5_9FABA|nr:hypothetical protein [Stylosanthes scabra]